jgi:hypothetical protein
VKCAQIPWKTVVPCKPHPQTPLSCPKDQLRQPSIGVKNAQTGNSESTDELSGIMLLTCIQSHESID